MQLAAFLQGCSEYGYELPGVSGRVRQEGEEEKGEEKRGGNCEKGLEKF